MNLLTVYQLQAMYQNCKGILQQTCFFLVCIYSLIPGDDSCINKPNNLLLIYGAIKIEQLSDHDPNKLYL